MRSSHTVRLTLFLTASFVATLKPGTAQAAQNSKSRTARKNYARAKASLEKERRALARSYRRASRKARPEILATARQALLRAIVEDLVPAWEGTPWAFSGTSDTPGAGEIACGTFVGTLLHHAGFRLNRIAIGRLASEHIALSLTRNKNLRRYSNRDGAEVVRQTEAWGPGLYMVGLDRHAALMFVDPARKAHLIHSSYYSAMSVVREPPMGVTPFADSKYRVIAKLLDDAMIRKWLAGGYFVATKG